MGSRTLEAVLDRDSRAESTGKEAVCEDSLSETTISAVSPSTFTSCIVPAEDVWSLQDVESGGESGRHLIVVYWWRVLSEEDESRAMESLEAGSRYTNVAGACECAICACFFGTKIKIYDEANQLSV